MFLPVISISFIHCQINTDQANIQTNNEKTPFSAFLIDNCDEEEPSKRSSPLQFPLSDCPIATKAVQSFDDSNENEQCGSLMNEFNTAEAEQEKRLHQRKKFYQRLKNQKVQCANHKMIKIESDQLQVTTLLLSTNHLPNGLLNTRIQI